MRKKIALIFGGRSLESDISVITAMQTLANIDKNAFAVEPVYMHEGEFYLNKLDSLESFKNFSPTDHKRALLYKGEFYRLSRKGLTKEFKPDAALVCCHGGEGENGVLQAMLDYNKIPYTSCGVLPSAIGMDKVACKQVCAQLLLNVVPFETVSKSELKSDPDGVISRVEVMLGYPLIVKPSSLGSSIGIGVAACREELLYALDVASRFDDKIIVEKKLTDCIEVNCAAFRDGDRTVVSVTEQPRTANDFLTFDDKYMDFGKMTASGHKIPADIGSLELLVKANTERLYKALDLNGVVRMDFLVDGNKVYINEINTVPGSLAYYLFEPLGISFEQLISKLIGSARTNGKSIPRAYRPEVLSKYSSGAKLKK